MIPIKLGTIVLTPDNRLARVTRTRPFDRCEATDLDNPEIRHIYPCSKLKAVSMTKEHSHE